LFVNAAETGVVSFQTLKSTLHLTRRPSLLRSRLLAIVLKRGILPLAHRSFFLAQACRYILHALQLLDLFTRPKYVHAFWPRIRLLGPHRCHNSVLQSCLAPFFFMYDNLTLL
jgi:hypothetical protein